MWTLGASCGGLEVTEAQGLGGLAERAPGQIRLSSGPASAARSPVSTASLASPLLLASASS